MRIEGCKDVRGLEELTYICIDVTFVGFYEKMIKQSRAIQDNG